MPRSKKDTLRIIDTKPDIIGGGTIQTQAFTIAPPPTGEVAAPSNLTATASGVVRSPVKPEAYVNVTWRAPLGGVVPSYYDIEYGRSSEWNNATKTFSNPQRVQSYNLAATLSLGLNTAYRIRVRSVYRNATSAWTDTVQVTTADDTTPPDPVTSVATNWNPITGDLTITWTNPTNAQFRDVRVRIYNSASKTILYRTALSTNGQYVYTYAQNLEDSSVGDPSLHITLDSRNWSASGTVYSTAVDVTTALAAPSITPNATPTVNGVTGSIYWNWSAVPNAVAYLLTIDGITRRIFTLTFEYTLAQNRIDHGGVVNAQKITDGTNILLDSNGKELTTTATSSVSWSLVAVDIYNQQSPAQTGSTSLNPPSTPTGLTADFTNPDCSFTWDLATDVTGYRLVIDNVSRDLGFVNSYTYTLAQNAVEHSNNPDPTLNYYIIAYNAFEMTAETTPATITSPLPNTPTSVTLTSYFDVLVANITAHVLRPTHRRYRFLFRKDGSDFATIFSQTSIARLEIDESGTYLVRVSAEDIFGRSSSTLDSSTVTPDVLTLEELRSAAIYTDSVGNTKTTLNVLKDDDKASGGVTYTAGSWKWTQFERPLLDRYKTITAGLFSPTSGTSIYFATSSDATTWQWWAGPVDPLKTTITISSVANETVAQGAALNVNTYATTTRWDLPSIIEARYIRIYHRNTGSNYTINEFYPRRLVQSDDIQAESIVGINIAGRTIEAGKIAVGTLTGNEISSTTTITAGTGTDVAVLNGSDITWRIYAGNTSPTLAPFKVDKLGKLYATGAEISGAVTVTGGNASTIGQRITGQTGLIVPGILLTDGTNVLLDNDNRYITDTTVNTTVSWYNLVLFTADGNSYSITNGTASVTQRTYLTWTAGGTTLSAVTTPPTTSSSVLVATVEPGAVALNIQAPAGATYISGEWINTGSITARNISANTITADQIAVGTITADRMNVTQLSAISANLGSITAGTVTGATIQTGASGARVVLDSTGLTTYNSSNQKIIEVTTATNGGISVSNNMIRINATGITFGGSLVAGNQVVAWYTDTTLTSFIGSMYGYVSGSSKKTVYISSQDDILLQASQGAAGGDVIIQTSLDYTTGDVLLQPYASITSRRVGIGTPSPSYLLDVAGTTNSNSYRVFGTQVVGAQITGWGAITGTIVRTGFDTGTVTLAGLAQRVGQIIADLRTHGLIA